LFDFLRQQIIFIIMLRSNLSLYVKMVLILRVTCTSYLRLQINLLA
jgi:hypothetical protein